MRALRSTSYSYLLYTLHYACQRKKVLPAIHSRMNFASCRLSTSCSSVCLVHSFNITVYMCGQKGERGKQRGGEKVKKIEVSSSALSKNTNTVKRKAEHNQKGLTDQLSFDLHTTTHRTTRTGRKDVGEVLIVRGVGIIILPR